MLWEVGLAFPHVQFSPATPNMLHFQSHFVQFRPLLLSSPTFVGASAPVWFNIPVIATYDARGHSVCDFVGVLFTFF